MTFGSPRLLSDCPQSFKSDQDGDRGHRNWVEERVQVSQTIFRELLVVGIPRGYC